MPDSASPDVIVIGGGPAGSTSSTLLAQHGLSVELFEREHVPPLPHRRVADPADVPRPQAARHARQDEGQPLRQEVQRAVRQPARQAVRAVLLHRPQAARVVADLAGPPQRVRPAHARTTPASTASHVHEGARVLEVLFEGDAGRRRPGQGRRTGRSARCGRRSSSTPAGRARMLIDRLGLREWDPVLKKAAVWTYWKGAYRDTGRDEGATHRHPDRGQEGLVLVHPAARRRRQRRRGGRLRLPVQEPRRRRTWRRSTSRRSAACPGLQPRIANATRCDVFRRQKEYTLPGEAGGRRRLGAGRRRVRLPRPAVLVRRAAGADLRRRWPPTRSPRGWRRATRRRRSSASGSRRSSQGMDRMRRLVCEFYDGLQLRPVRPEAPAPEGPRHRRADRRRVQGRGGRALAADGRDAGRAGIATASRWRQGVSDRTRCEHAGRVPATTARPGWRGGWPAYVLMLAAAVGLFFLIRHVGEGLTAPEAPPGAVSVAAPKAGQVDVVVHVLATLAAVVGLGYVLGRAVPRTSASRRSSARWSPASCSGRRCSGRSRPEAMHWLIPGPDADPKGQVASALKAIAQLGVILYMFLVGLELNAARLKHQAHADRRHLARQHRRAVRARGGAGAVAVPAAVAPRGAVHQLRPVHGGGPVGHRVPGAGPHPGRPRAGRRPTSGVMALGCAAADDVTAWCLLAFVVGVAQAQVGGGGGRRAVGGGVHRGHVPGRPAGRRRWSARKLDDGPLPRGGGAGGAGRRCCCRRLATEAIGVHAVFGAFLLGAVIPHDSRLAREFTAPAQATWSTVLLLPAFFALHRDADRDRPGRAAGRTG